MKKYLTIFLISLISIAKVSAANKPTSCNKHQQPAAKEPFKTFFEKFSNNPSFQTASIVFPLKIMRIDEDGNSAKFIKKTDWKFTNLLRLKNKKGVIKIAPVNENEVDVKYTIIDTGVLVEHFFQYKAGKWWLVYVKDESD